MVYPVVSVARGLNNNTDKIYFYVFVVTSGNKWLCTSCTVSFIICFSLCLSENVMFYLSIATFYSEF